MLTALKIRIPHSYANVEYLRPNFLEVESEMESFTHKIVEESFTMPFFFLILLMFSPQHLITFPMQIIMLFFRSIHVPSWIYSAN